MPKQAPTTQQHHYLALTIGPIYRTMGHARSTRQLWAASFIFSTLMRALLQRLSTIGKVLAPDASNIHATQKTYHGAGIWPDRCFIELEQAPDAAVVQGHIEQAIQEIANRTQNNALQLLQKYFHVYAVYACYGAADITTDPVASDPVAEQRAKSVIFKLNKLLDDVELRSKVIPQGTDSIIPTLDKAPDQNLYVLGFAPNDKVMVYYLDQQQQQRPRVPSLLEIALREFKGKQAYQKVEKEISKSVRNYRGQEDDDQLQEELLKAIKAEAELAPLFRQRHKYIAIIQADGDGIGKLIGSLGHDAAKLQAFSQKLMQFAQGAAATVADFGGFPIYIGGDDLLLVTPVVNHEQKSVLDLIQDLRDNFQKQFNKQTGISLSFGLSITYYKHPLEEALNKAYELLQYQAKVFSTQNAAGAKQEKDALAYYLETHSGQGFGTTIHQNGKVYRCLQKLCAAALAQEPGWLSGLTYRLRELGTLLEHANSKGTLATFFKSHFNELQGNAQKKAFLDEIEQLIQFIYEEYPELPSSAALSETNFTPQTELLYSILRFAQFFNAPDHE